MGECVLSVLVHVWAVGPCNLAGGRRALALEVHLLLVSLLGSILGRVEEGKGPLSLHLSELPKSYCRGRRAGPGAAQWPESLAGQPFAPPRPVPLRPRPGAVGL